MNVHAASLPGPDQAVIAPAKSWSSMEKVTSPRLRSSLWLWNLEPNGGETDLSACTVSPAAHVQHSSKCRKMPSSEASLQRCFSVLRAPTTRLFGIDT